MPKLKRTLALDQELFNSIRLIKVGLGQLQSTGEGNGFYHLPLLTLASGFERFMKVTLCFRWLGEYGSFPTKEVFPSGRDGHDLKNLLKEIRSKCFLECYINNIPVAQDDLKYLNSEDLLSFVSVLSNFGQAARYYNLDVVVGRKVETEDSEAEWKKIETEILLSRKDLMEEFESNPASNCIDFEIKIEVVKRLEKFARAISRLYSIGKIGEHAKRHVAYIGCFLFLSDEQLGKNKYN